MKEFSELHNKETNKIELDIMKSLDENIKYYEALFKNCDDVVKKKFLIGEHDKVWGYISYVDVMIDRKVIEQSVLEKLIEDVRFIPENISNKSNLYEYVKDYAIASADVKEITKFDDACNAVLSGDTVMFIDGFAKGIVIATRGWPSRGIQEPDTEGVVRGSKEGFSEPLRFNTVLIRRRIRDTKLKIRQEQIGIRSRTDIAIVYIEDLARKELLKEIDIKIHSFNVDAVLESGVLEELMENDWKSPFPRMQVTQRPDKVAAALLEGRVAIVVDNTPFVLLMPTSINAFYQASEDYFQDWIYSSFVRFLRYVSGFLAMTMPGFYIALTCFHPAMIPAALDYSIAAARQGVPFPTIIELLLMELEFELLREAGVRLPGSIGNTISIVGGLIIGQAAVTAKLVSPIVVVIVAITAIASFSIPSFALINTYRILKYFIIIASAIFGIFGFWIAILIILVHLVSLKSMNFPYMMPFVSDEVTEFNGIKDTLFRLPIIFYKNRPIYTRPKARFRLKIKK